MCCCSSQAHILCHGDKGHSMCRVLRRCDIASCHLPHATTNSTHALALLRILLITRYDLLMLSPINPLVVKSVALPLRVHHSQSASLPMPQLPYGKSVGESMRLTYANPPYAPQEVPHWFLQTRVQGCRVLDAEGLDINYLRPSDEVTGSSTWTQSRITCHVSDAGWSNRRWEWHTD